MNAYYQLTERRPHTDGSVVATYQPTQHTQGAWNAHEQHMAAASGVIAHELWLYSPRPHMRIGRISFDIFGLIALDICTITTRTIRPGKTIELIESTMQAQGKTCIVARAWRMAVADTQTIAGLEDTPIQTPHTLPRWTGMSRWPGGFIQTLQVHACPTHHRSGKGTVWIGTDVEMVQGETTSDFARIIGLVDTANGIVPRQGDALHWAFPNLDLHIHMHRLPRGKWLGMDAVQQYGQDGIGLTSAVLHDIHGPFGRSEQILTLRPMPANSIGQPRP